MGSQQSRPEAALLSTATGHEPTQTAQCDVYSQPLVPGSLGSSTVTAITPVMSSPDIRPSGAFPTDLPERPPKPSRLSLRKKKSVIPTPLLPNPMSLSSLPSPPLSPQSSVSTNFTQKTQPYQPYQHEEPLVTPPSSPIAPRRLGRFSRKPFRLDGTSHLLKPTTSTPSFTTTLHQSDPYWTQQHLSPQLNSRLSLTPVSSARETPASSFTENAYDPLAQRFAQLQLDHFSSTSFSGAPTDYLTQNLDRKPLTDQSEMGPSRHTSRSAPGEASSPYQVKRGSQPSKRAARTRKVPGRRISRSDREDDVVYPDLSQLAARASSWSPPLFETGSRPNTTERRAASAAQEGSDRDLALQLQNEEDGILFNTNNRPRRRREPRPISRSPSPSDDDLLSDWKPWIAPQTNDVRLRRKPVSSTTRGTREDPINLDSDNEVMHDTDSAYAQQLQDEEVANRLNQEETDAEFALRLQREEEEERQRQLDASAMRDCAVCGDSFPIRDLPALVNCTHEPQTCATCYQTWIETELNAKSWNSISCPWSECQNILQHHEVQQYATPEIYERFDKLSARSALNDDPNFYNCMARNCNSGQFHYRDEQGPIFRCVECDFQFCIVHKNTWHKGETCEEYDYRISGRKELDQRRQEAASEKAIKELAKKCPGKNCNYHIEKNDGCDHMTCRKCRHEFCWECLAPYRAIRARSNAAHNRGCKYHSDNIN